MFLASQIVGAVAFIVYIASYWQKDRRKLLTLSIIECILFCVQYFLLGSITGAIINLVGIVRSSSFMYKDKNKFMSTLAMPMIINALYALNCALTWDGWITLVPTVASFIKCFNMWQNNSKSIRRYGIPIQILWLIYGIYLGSYVSIVSQIILIIAIAVAIVRLDIIKTSKANYKIRMNVNLNALEKIFKEYNQFIYDIATIKDPDYIKFVCMKGNKVVGYAAVYPYSNFMERQGFKKDTQYSDFSVFIWHIVVKKGYERKGIGTTLVKEIERIYQGYDIYSVLDSRNNPSILFHNSLGFVKKEDFEQVFNNKIEKFDIMQLKRQIKEPAKKETASQTAETSAEPEPQVNITPTN
ncbi:MAG: GNAT family N-acetyltransferase [Christensenellales bacterium]